MSTRAGAPGMQIPSVLHARRRRHDSPVALHRGDGVRDRGGLHHGEMVKMTLAEFLLARIADDEAAVREALNGRNLGEEHAFYSH